MTMRLHMYSAVATALQVVKGLAAAAQACGARIRTGCEVARVLSDPAVGAATGVQLTSGEILRARAVVCNR